MRVSSRWCPIMATVVLLIPAAGAEQLQVANPELPCSALVSQGHYEEALAPCREELAENPHSPELTRALAAAEFVAGDPERSVRLWTSVLEHEGWEAEAARGLAMATWRAGRPADAEPMLRELVERAPDLARSHRDLVNFLLSFERAEDALPVVAEATARFPDNCEVLEDRGVVEAAVGSDAQAAAFIDRAVTAGCPPFRWTQRGALPQRLDRPAYAGLLTPEKLVADLDQLDDRHCRERLALLKPRMSTAAADAVTAVVLERKTAEVRLAGLGLLASLGAEALPWWEKILDTDDFILEKHALRRIREVGDPAFVPLLEKRLAAEQTPGNRALTRLTLGEVLLPGPDAARGRELMMSIPEDSDLFPVALMALADHEQGQGHLKEALELIERAVAVNPELYVNPDRLQKLRRELGDATTATDEAPKPE